MSKPSDVARLRWLPRLPGWSGRSDVQRVDLYTRGSLHVIYWFLLVLGTLSAASGLSTRLDLVAVAAAGLALGVTGAGVVRAAFALYPRTGPLPLRRIAVLLAVAVAVGGWILTLAPDQVVGPSIVLVSTLGWALGGLRDRRVLWVVVLAGALVMGVPSANPYLAAYGAGLAVFFGFTVQSSLWLLDVVTELDRGRSSQAALAVAEERLRFSRDVHDVMGRHLSTIAVQAELALTMAERGDERAPDLVKQVRSTAHEALREARELARGYRPLDLDQELDGAVSLLGSAGISARADLTGLPGAWHPPVARMVRETVTNVLRHSAATWVHIGFDGRVVEVRNDGVPREPVAGGVGHEGDGSGLSALAAEMAGLGAGFWHGVRGEEFVVRLTLQEAS